MLSSAGRVMHNQKHETCHQDQRHLCLTSEAAREQREIDGLNSTFDSTAETPVVKLSRNEVSHTSPTPNLATRRIEADECQRNPTHKISKDNSHEEIGPFDRSIESQSSQPIKQQCDTSQWSSTGSTAPTDNKDRVGLTSSESARNVGEHTSSEANPQRLVASSQQTAISHNNVLPPAPPSQCTSLAALLGIGCRKPSKVASPTSVGRSVKAAMTKPWSLVVKNPLAAATLTNTPQPAAPPAVEDINPGDSGAGLEQKCGQLGGRSETTISDNISLKSAGGRSDSSGLRVGLNNRALGEFNPASHMSINQNNSVPPDRSTESITNSSLYLMSAHEPSLQDAALAARMKKTAVAGRSSNDWLAPSSKPGDVLAPSKAKSGEYGATGGGLSGLNMSARMGLGAIFAVRPPPTTAEAPLKTSGVHSNYGQSCASSNWVTGTASSYSKVGGSSGLPRRSSGSGGASWVFGSDNQFSDTVKSTKEVVADALPNGLRRLPSNKKSNFESNSSSTAKTHGTETPRSSGGNHKLYWRPADQTTSGSVPNSMDVALAEPQAGIKPMSGRSLVEVTRELFGVEDQVAAQSACRVKHTEPQKAEQTSRVNELSACKAKTSSPLLGNQSGRREIFSEFEKLGSNWTDSRSISNGPGSSEFPHEVAEKSFIESSSPFDQACDPRGCLRRTNCHGDGKVHQISESDQLTSVNWRAREENRATSSRIQSDAVAKPSSAADVNLRVTQGNKNEPLNHDHGNRMQMDRIGESRVERFADNSVPMIRKNVMYGEGRDAARQRCSEPMMRETQPPSGGSLQESALKTAISIEKLNYLLQKSMTEDAKSQICHNSGVALSGLSEKSAPVSLLQDCQMMAFASRDNGGAPAHGPRQQQHDNSIGTRDFSADLSLYHDSLLWMAKERDSAVTTAANLLTAGKRTDPIARNNPLTSSSSVVYRQPLEHGREIKGSIFQPRNDEADGHEGDPNAIIRTGYSPFQNPNKRDAYFPTNLMPSAQMCDLPHGGRVPVSQTSCSTDRFYLSHQQAVGQRSSMPMSIAQFSDPVYLNSFQRAEVPSPNIEHQRPLSRPAASCGANFPDYRRFPPDDKGEGYVMPPRNTDLDFVQDLPMYPELDEEAATALYSTLQLPPPFEDVLHLSADASNPSYDSLNGQFRSQSPHEKWRSSGRAMNNTSVTIPIMELHGNGRSQQAVQTKPTNIFPYNEMQNSVIPTNYGDETRRLSSNVLIGRRQPPVSANHQDNGIHRRESKASHRASDCYMQAIEGSAGASCLPNVEDFSSRVSQQGKYSSSISLNGNLPANGVALRSDRKAVETSSHNADLGTSDNIYVSNGEVVPDLHFAQHRVEGQSRRRKEYFQASPHPTSEIHPVQQFHPGLVNAIRHQKSGGGLSGGSGASADMHSHSVLQQPSPNCSLPIEVRTTTKQEMPASDRRELTKPNRPDWTARDKAVAKQLGETKKHLEDSRLQTQKKNHSTRNGSSLNDGVSSVQQRSKSVEGGAPGEARRPENGNYRRPGSRRRRPRRGRRSGTAASAETPGAPQLSLSNQTGRVRPPANVRRRRQLRSAWQVGPTQRIWKKREPQPDLTTTNLSKTVPKSDTGVPPTTLKPENTLVNNATAEESVVSKADIKLSAIAPSKPLPLNDGQRKRMTVPSTTKSAQSTPDNENTNEMGRRHGNRLPRRRGRRGKKGGKGDVAGRPRNEVRTNASVP